MYDDTEEAVTRAVDKCIEKSILVDFFLEHKSEVIYFIFYLVIMNGITFLVYGVDKYKAKKHKWRISENMLMGLAAIGGFVGAFAGMQVFRHKTKHMKFVVGVPMIAVVWMIAIVYYWMKY